MQNNLLVAINASLVAGLAIMDIYNNPDADFSIEKKSDSSPLTIADRESHQIISGYLKNTVYPVLSEEGIAIDFEKRSKWDTLWIVDPLDGTKEFIKRNGEFTVNIGLVENGVPVLGVIYLPVKKILYFAAKGIGAYKTTIDTNLLPYTLAGFINISEKMPLKQNRRNYVVVASRSHCSEETKEFIHSLEKQHGSVETISSGSSIKICLVAEGSADIYPRLAPTMEWDTAAGHAIARASGKDIYKTDCNEALNYNKQNLQNPWFIVK